MTSNARAPGRRNVPTEAHRSLTLDDLARVVSAHDVALSPDGTTAAVVLERIDEPRNALRRRIVVVDLATGRQRTLATGGAKLATPAFSPDGRRIAYRRERRGVAQVFVTAVKAPFRPGGRAVAVAAPLTSHPTDVSLPAWSPDGRSIVYVADGPARVGDPIPVADRDDRRRVVRVKGHRHKLEGRGYFAAHQHLWLVASGGGEARQLTDGDAGDTSPAWSPDGRSIAFVSDRSADRDRHFGGGAVHVLDVATRRVRRVSPEGRSAALPAWSPDGRRIAYLRTEHPLEVDGSVERLWVLTVANRRESCWTASIDRAVGFRPGGYRTPSPPAWAADGRSVIQILSDGGTAQLVRIAEGEVTPLTDGRHVIAEFAANRATSRVVFLGTDPTTPLELWRWDASTGVDRVGGWNDRLPQDHMPNQPRRLSVTRPGGLAIEAWLYVPAAGKARRVAGRGLPLVVMVHGGPHNAYGDTWNAEVQLLAGAGYAVLAVNPRGSGGYGDAFARAVVGDWGGGDLSDILAVLDHVLSAHDPAIDPARVGMTGGSYGGFMTCWAITQIDRFAAAVAGAPVTSLESEFGTADIGPSWLRGEQGGAPWERPETYRAHSPLQFAERVRTPLLLYHGEADLRCPIEQSEQFFTALTAHGAEVELLRVPAEGHVLPGEASPAHRRVVRQAILDWFGRYLLGPRPAV